MGFARLGEICRALIAGGRAPETPVAIVQWGATVFQKQVFSSLEHAEREAAAAAIFRFLRDRDGSGDAKHYLSLMRYFGDRRAEIAALPAKQAGEGEKRPLLIALALWGDSYVESLLAYTFPSLLAPGDLPRLAQGRAVVFDISRPKRTATGSSTARPARRWRRSQPCGSKSCLTRCSMS